MSNLRMLFLDDMAARHEVIGQLADRFDITHVYDARTCIRALNDSWDVVSLDHDLEDEHYAAYHGYAEQAALARTGWDVVVFLRSWPEERKKDVVVNVHSANPPAKERMMAELRANGFTVYGYSTTDFVEVLKNA